jgi:hypothetical protein
MKRVAFTIILNGLHHLTHKNYFDTMSKNFDLWVIVEGVSSPGGSTSWCRNIDSSFHKDYLSNDGTTEFLDKNKRDNIIVVRTTSDIPWSSKDEQVNAAISEIKKRYQKCFLWQIDIDEQWTLQQLIEAEQMLIKNKGKTGCFTCNYFVGRNQQVFGEWGECKYEAYRRLWNWEGEMFKTHEPPQLEGKNGPGLLLPQRFNHFSYYFESDVVFKEKYYGGYTGLYNRWKKVQSNKGTIPIIELLGPDLRWSYTNTIIKYVNDN